MQDLEKLGRSLMEGSRGDTIRRLADSAEGRALGQKLDGAAIEQAVRSGDSAQLRALLQNVLSTGEGRALAEKLSKMGL